MITFKKTDAACVCMFARVCVILAEADKDLRRRKVDIILNYAENLRRVNKFYAFNHIILKYGAMDAFEELAQSSRRPEDSQRNHMATSRLLLHPNSNIFFV